MLIGILMLTAPIIVYLATLPLSRRLNSRLKTIYRIASGIVILFGELITIYLAAFKGDQGGIAAFFFQSGVITSYIAISVIIVCINKAFFHER